MSTIEKVQDIIPRIQYTATAGQTIFVYPFPIFDEGDIAVEQNGTLLTLATDYIVSGVGAENGGNITLIVGATSGDIITIYRDMALERLIDYQQNGSFLANTVNNDYDRLWLAIQQLRGGASNGEGVGRAWRAAPGDSLTAQELIIADEATRSGRFVGFDSNGKFTYSSPAISSDPSQIYSDVLTMQNDSSLTVGQFVRTVGYKTAGDDGGNDYEIGTGFGTADGGSIIDLPGSGLQAKGLFVDKINISQFGASPNAIASVNTISIQNAWDYGSSIGRIVEGSPGIFLVEKSGNQISSRDYGLLIPDGLKFDGLSSSQCVIKAASNTDMDIITTNRLSQINNISLKNFTVDGNSANQTPNGPNQTLGGMNIWVERVEGLHIDDVVSKDSAAFGFRLAILNNVFCTTMRCDHRPDINADGIHFKDSTNVVIDKAIVFTQGDDGFIINAETADCHDFSIGEIVINAPVFVAAGRGMYISNAEANNSAGIQRSIYNINVANLVTYNCDATALLLAYANFYNININHTDYGSVVGLGFIVGSTVGVGVTGSIKNSQICSSIWEPQNQGIQTVVSDGTISYSKITAVINNPGDGFIGAELSGENCTFDILMDYDPSSTKASPVAGIRGGVQGTFTGNNLYATVNGADKGISLSSATNNNIYIGNVTNSVTADLDFNVGADNNKVIGGSLSSFENSGSENRIVGTSGAANYGIITLTPDGSGQDVIPHGLIATPNFFQVNAFSGSQVIATVSARDATNLTVTFRDYTGALITTGSHQVTWEASIF